MPFFTPAQREAIKRKLRTKTRQRNLTLKGIDPPLSIEAQFLQNLRGGIRRTQNQINAQILPLLAGTEQQYVRDSAPQLETFIKGAVDDLARLPATAEATQARIAARMANSVEAFNRRRFIRDIRGAVGVDLSDIIKQEGAQLAVEESIAENVDLIKSISEQHLDKIKGAIGDGISQGDDFFSIRKQILTIGESTKARAKFIARDQVAKLNGKITEIRQTKLGVTHYFWRTSQDERVRDTHEAHANERFAWDSPPADTGHPGQDFQCRCVAEADLSHVLAFAA